VHGLDHHRPLANTRGHTLDRAATHIPHRKDAGLAGGEWYGGTHALAIDAGDDETFRIQCKATIEPIRVRLGADHDEYVGYSPGFR
jgi:hypothetical protein